jgi:hypothetical protein
LTSFLNASQTVSVLSSSSGSSDLSVLLSGMWEGGRSQQALNLLTANPWQLFAPRRIWLPIPSAAVAPTLTAAIAHNLGSTVVTPRVTFTR